MRKVIVSTAAIMGWLAMAWVSAAAEVAAWQQPQQPQPASQVAQQAGSQVTDSSLASMAIVDNIGEVQLARLATRQTRNEAVGNFARQMIEDHGRFIQQLQQAGGVLPSWYKPMEVGPHGHAQTRPQTSRQAWRGPVPAQQTAAPAQQGQMTPGPTMAAQTAARQVTPSQAVPSQATHGQGWQVGSSQVDFVQLQQQVGQKVESLIGDELQRHQGEAFDRPYLGQQIAAHLEMLGTLQTYRQHASPQLRSILDEGIHVAEHHLAEARDLMRQLGGGAPGVARRQSQTNR
jgi:predicted outer membrane protein